MIVVRFPPRYGAERRYILGVVLGEWLGLQWRPEEHEHADVEIGLDGVDDRVVTVPDTLFATEDAQWLTAASLPRLPVSWRAVGAAGAGVLGATERLPVLYGPPVADDRPLAEVDDGGVRLNVDMFGSAFAMLTRYEEAIPGERDAYGRYPAAAALAVRENFLRTPVVDAYVELLRAALQGLWPQLTTAHGDYRVLLSHDVDDPLSTVGRSRGLLARQLAGDVVRRRDVGLLVRRARAQADLVRGRLDRDPHNTFDFLMTVSERHGLRSAFYFLSNNDVDPHGGRYDLVDHPWVGNVMRNVHRRGHEVGFHGGLDTFRDPELTGQEFAHLRDVAAKMGVVQERWGGRQHYLQWANPETWRNWDDAGLDYDCSLAFSERVGFRTGTCREYPVFDLGARTPLTLREQPFQVMDVTLLGHMGLRPEEAQTAVFDIARACRRFRGDLGILWHNDEYLRTTRQKRWYAELVAAVTV
jgi:hypothetical protein